MRSACKALSDPYLGACAHRDTCLRYQLHRDQPLGWAAHRQCRTSGYDFFLPDHDDTRSLDAAKVE